ncbi:MAG: ShlB/FhaC/HecB family hemolysin secretion/activation protein, partial [Casimicrobiaceae bacterium]
ADKVPPERLRSQAPTPSVLPRQLVDQVRFTIAEIRIEGNTLVTTPELLEQVRGFLGSSKSLDDLNGARDAIRAAYRSRGYELLSVDYLAGRSRAGIHYLAVREVRIGKVTVKGTREIAEGEVRRQLPDLKEGGTPRLGPLARELFLFNDNPGRNATLEFAAGAPGVTDVEIKVAEQPQSRLAATFNNTGNQATGSTRVGLNWNHANFLGLSHQVGASVTTSVERPERVFQAGFGYSVPLPTLGDTLSFSASYSDSDSGRVADVFNISGKGTTFGAHYQHNLRRDALSRHVLDVGYDERHYRDIVDFFGTNLGVSVTVKPVSAGYRYLSNGSGESLSLGATVQQNLPGGVRNDDATYAASRAGADARWQAWQFDAAWQRELASGWMPAVRMNAQYTSDPLIAAEQFGLGGLRAVRGFREREGAGDRGLRGSFELSGPRIARTHRLLAFFDAGRSTRLNAQPGEIVTEGLSSIGIGWRGQFGSSVQVSADFAQILNGTARNPRGDRFLHLSAVWWF